MANLLSFARNLLAFKLSDILGTASFKNNFEFPLSSNLDKKSNLLQVIEAKLTLCFSEFCCSKFMLLMKGFYYDQTIIASGS